MNLKRRRDDGACRKGGNNGTNGKRPETGPKFPFVPLFPPFLHAPSSLLLLPYAAEFLMETKDGKNG
jgi:hypothetical protein